MYFMGGWGDFCDTIQSGQEPERNKRANGAIWGKWIPDQGQSKCKSPQARVSWSVCGMAGSACNGAKEVGGRAVGIEFQDKLVADHVSPQKGYCFKECGGNLMGS